jgi:hypothetical protein
MSLILVLTIGQAISSTLAWIGFYAAIRALPGGRARQSRWIIGSAVVRRGLDYGMDAARA